MTDYKAAALKLKADQPALSAAQIAKKLGTTKDAVQKWIRRTRPSFPSVSLPKPLTIRAEKLLVIGDVHSYSADISLLEQAIKESERLKVREVAIVGDLTCFDRYSQYKSIFGYTPLTKELEATRHIMSRLTAAFDRVWWITGNHDERLSRYLDGDFSLEMLADLVCPSRRDKLVISPINFAWLRSGREKWLLSHEYRYSKNPTSVARQLSAFHQCHVIHHHQHLFGMSFSDNGKYFCIDNGCICRQDKTAYAATRLSSMPSFKQSYLIIDGGKARVCVPGAPLII